MSQDPTNQNNLQQDTPRTFGTLPLEPRVSREQQEADAPYMPQPPRPKDFAEVEQKLNTQASEGPARQDATGRTYETPQVYREAAVPPHARQDSLRPGAPAPNAAAPQPTANPAAQQRPLMPPPPAPRNPQPQPSARPTVIGGMGSQGMGNPMGGQGYPSYGSQPPVSSGGKGKLIGIIIAAAATLIVAVGLIWYFASSDNSSEATSLPTVPNAENTESAETPAGATPDGQVAEQTETQATATQTTEDLSLFNRPLTYAGTVSPGGAASLNIVLYQNGRIEGSLNYSDGKTMPLYGSYTWTDNGHKMNVNFTVSSNSDKAYSESWMGSSSYIKDDLAHTLTFSRINTSNGQSMTASFALKP